MIIGLSLWALRDRPSWVAWILYFAFLMCASLFAQLILQSSVRLIVDTDGILDTGWEIGTVRWADVDKVFVRDDAGAEVVCILLLDSARPNYRMGKIDRKLSEAMRLAGYGDFTVNTTRLGIRADDVLKLAGRGMSATG